ncbi:MAG: di-trans,poly-cis-decaprenylcistransferase [Nitrospirota bacterium]|nr:MAG: di-trans,poly-cis-decaprenylcistransferase [Nitrospirota bacterium]
MTMLIKGEKIPAHIGVIMDGNGRWAQMRGLSRVEGHRQGARRTRDIIDAAINIGVDVLTLYAFSIENWNRPKMEVDTLMGLLEHYLMDEVEELIRERAIIFRMIGDRNRLPAKIQELVKDIETRTVNNEGMILVPAISYGGKDEVIRAFRKIIDSGTPVEDIDDKMVDHNLDTSGLPPVDLIIRTSGEKRVSNFLLWQGAYAEFYFTETLWPDFTSEEFLQAIGDYQKRERRYGEINQGGII